jgi:hypothetical protein
VQPFSMVVTSSSRVLVCVAEAANLGNLRFKLFAIYVTHFGHGPCISVRIVSNASVLSSPQCGYEINKSWRFDPAWRYPSDLITYRLASIIQCQAVCRPFAGHGVTIINGTHECIYIQ